MTILDENFPEDQLPLLREWHIACRQIGRDIGTAGAQDGEVIRLLHRHRGATLFTLDQDFFRADLCHNAYCLVWLDVRMDDAAYSLPIFSDDYCATLNSPRAPRAWAR